MSLRSLMRSSSLLAGLLLLSSPAVAQNLLDQFEDRVTEFTLDNGLHFIVIERHEAPVATFYTYADVGAVDEVKGITGLAHMFEHMAFKGTTTIGSAGWSDEDKAIREVDRIYADLRAEQHKGRRADSTRLAELESRFKEAQKAAQDLAIPEFEEVLERHGGTGLNATTAWDRTDYFVSLPVNKTEIWFSLESERFADPVLREFYVERDVVAEERRLRTESNPFGRLSEEFFTTSYKAHPYGEPVIGHMSDIQTYTREEGVEFFKKYYNPSNLTIAIAGDVDPDEIKRLADTYFGRLPRGSKPAPIETVEPPQGAERRVIIEEQTQPIIIAGWHKGSVNDPDHQVYEVLADVLSGGRTSRFYRELVEGSEIALEAAAINGFPGMNKYPHQFLIYAVMNQGHGPEAFEEAAYAILDEIRENGISEEELERAKTRSRASLVRQLQSNSGLARLLTYHEVVTGDWSDVFRQLDRIEAVTSADIQRVLDETFQKSNRTVAMIKTMSQPQVSDAAERSNDGTQGD